MQFATHYYLLIDWVGEGEAGRRRGRGKGKEKGGGGGRENVWLEDMTLGSYLSFTISGCSFNSFKLTIL